MRGSPYLHHLAAPFRHEAPGRDGVLLLHGWTGSPAHMRMLGAHLHSAGYSVDAPLFAGHGTRVEDMLDTGWRDWVETAAEAAQRLVDAGKRLHIVGLSMGGVIGILLARPFGAVSLATLSAPQRIFSRTAYLAPIAKRVTPLRPPGELNPPDDPEAAAFYQQYHATPVTTIEHLLLLIRASGRALGRVTAPLLIVQSRADETVRPESAELLYRRAASKDKRIVWLDRSRHVVTLDAERDHVHDQVTRHIARVAARLDRREGNAVPPS